MRRIFDFLYASALIVASPWLVYRALFRGRNRRGWRQKLLGTIPRRETDCECIWLHAVSVGEVNLLAPVIERLQQQRPDAEFAISTTTETGFDLARTKYACHTVFFCPFDFSWAVKRALQRLRPSVIVLAELEVWPNLIAIATDQNIPVAVINGRLSESSFRGYRRAGRLLKPTFARLTQVAAANEQYADRFLQLGTPNDRVTVTGTVKFVRMIL
jgi:3-deoxy-D-manno-octulosonic-acid transferase